jgi:uncharacterized protein with HEPN domain
LPPRDARKYLCDIAEAADQPPEFVAGKSLDDHLGDRLLQAAVERHFEVVGEALNADVDDKLVWNIIETRLPFLRGLSAMVDI